MAKLYLVSLGCNKNLVDSEIMLGKLKDYEITDEPNLADVIIINTCGFIASAKEESINTILELAKQKKPNSILIVTGCLSQRYKDELIKELPEVDIFSGVGDYYKIDEMILKKQNLFSPSTYLQTTDERIITGSSYHAYIKLSEGCNQKCSFCAIPSFKGRLKSRNLSDIIQEIKNLVSKGYHDFSFISQDSSSYGKDLGFIPFFSVDCIFFKLKSTSTVHLFSMPIIFEKSIPPLNIKFSLNLLFEILLNNSSK